MRVVSACGRFGAASGGSILAGATRRLAALDLSLGFRIREYELNERFLIPVVGDSGVR